MAAWSVCFYMARRERARNLLLEKSLIPSYVERKMLEAVRGEGNLPACLVLLKVFLTQSPGPVTATN